ncbi:hypothetical protein QTP70_010587 [Hemibagrus guttatus]|uniref:Uncharacterized protein n=1 Tax=Hemibagrus guttatus TaxID=175788 RepID=A0AAE0PYS9_9TELE|nr:hypothetical protein QTP70_010587 [Hemibagrus guttatus]
MFPNSSYSYGKAELAVMRPLHSQYFTMAMRLLQNQPPHRSSCSLASPTGNHFTSCPEKQISLMAKWTLTPCPHSLLLPAEICYAYLAHQRSAMVDSGSTEALCELYGAIRELPNAHPDGLFIITNHTNLKSVLPKFHQYVDFASRGVNTLDLVYRNIPDSTLSLRHETIIVVPKKSPVSCLNDYHPIALTPITMKCFKMLIMRHIKNLLPPSLDPMQYAYHQITPQTMPSAQPSIWTIKTLMYECFS